MAMTRKDYNNLATALGMSLRYASMEDDAGLRTAIVTVADALNSANMNFDRARFVQFVDEVAMGARDAEGRKVKGAA